VVAVTALTCDLAVVGGGIMGATLLLLAREAHPDWSLALLDQTAPGEGATKWSGALVVPYGPDAGSRALMTESWRAYLDAPLRAYVRELPALVVVSADQVERIQAAIIPAALPQATDAMRRTLRAYYPDLRVTDDEVVLDARDHAFVVDVHDLIRDAARLDGITVWPGARVEGAFRGDGHWSLRTQTGAMLRSRRVVIATGPWPRPGVDPNVLAPRPVRVKRVVALHVDAPSVAAPSSPRPVVLLPRDDMFVLPSEGHLIVSFYRDEWLAADAPLLSGVSEADIAAGRAVLRARSPALADRIFGGRAFYDAYTPDRVPLVRVGGGDRSIVEMTGGSGSGVRFAPGIARRTLATLDSAASPRETSHKQ
jgi:D-arginine dehydrogenase